MLLAPIIISAAVLTAVVWTCSWLDKAMTNDQDARRDDLCASCRRK
jgi:hypothetical protein